MDTSEKTSGLGIYPAFFSLTLKKGEERTLSLVVENNYAVPLIVSGKGLGFQQDTDSLMNIITMTDTFERWVLFENQVVNPGKQTELSFSVRVPDDIPLTAGSYYPALLMTFAPTGQADGELVRISHAIPLYLELSENAVVEVSVSRFRSPRLVIGSNVDISTELLNTGNTHIRPSGYLKFSKIDLFDTSNHTRIETIPLNPRQMMLLPESRLSEEISWTWDSIGHYQSDLYVMSEGADLQVKSIDFWIVPTTWLMIAGTVVAVLVGSILLKIFGKKRPDSAVQSKPKRMSRVEFLLRRTRQ